MLEYRMGLLSAQVSAIAKLQHLKVGALYMEPGTGKTRSAIELIKSIPGSPFILWLTPFRTKDNLRDELDKWGGLNCEIVGIETLSSSDRVYLYLSKALEAADGNSVVIVDESLKIKNWEAKRTQRIIQLGKLATYRLILNGTPISRNLLDAWAQFEFLSPMILNMDSAEYKNTFCEYTRITKRFGSYKQYTKEFITKYHNVDYLYSLIQPYVFECDLNVEVGKQYIDIDFELDIEHKKEYQRLKEEYLDNEKLQWLNNNIFLELTQKMQHVYTNSSEKFAIIDKVLKDTNPDKVLIFRKYLSAEAELKKRYPKLRILSIQSESFGLNLQEYDTIIIWDKVWDYALVKQMEHRIWRTGQTNTCRFINLNGNVNLERLIMNNINKKQGLLEYFKTKALKEAIEEL
jgi:SNF2 family DNA or RNA helicase